jgi:hypothetical protein
LPGLKVSMDSPEAFPVNTDRLCRWAAMPNITARPGATKMSA